MDKKLWSIVGGVALLGVAAGAYFLLGNHHPATAGKETAEPPPVAEAAAAPVSAVAPVSEALPESSPAASKAAALPPLPELASSDSFVLDGLTGALGDKSLLKLFVPERIIKRIVATVINLPQQRVAANIMPFSAPPQHFLIREQQGAQTIAAENISRYVEYARMANAVNARKLVALYVRLYPLFQEEYEKLGYPSQLFNDQLLETLDDLIDTPDVKTPIKLVQPKYYYQYADAELEDLSIGQKIMIRLGAENMSLVRHKLEEIKKELLLHAKELEQD